MKKITIRDIAKQAEVSISTVSFVINGKGEKMAISPAVIKKVCTNGQDSMNSPELPLPALWAC